MAVAGAMTIKSISKAKSVSISPLEMKVKTQNNKIFSAIAINEISLLRNGRQAASLQIKNGNNYHIYIF